MTQFSKVALMVLCTVLVFSSCRKEEETIAVIRITDIEGAGQIGVTVTLLVPPDNTTGEAPGTLIDPISLLTDASGEAVFDFTDSYEEGQAGFRVLNIEAFKDTLEALGVIKIDPETVNEETLILQ